MEENRNPNPAPEAEPVLSESPANMPEMEEEEGLAARPGGSKKWYIIAGLLVVFLAAAVFFGARLLRPEGVAAEGGKGGNGMFLSSKGGPGGAKSVRIDMKPAKELPQNRPAASGLFVRRDDQSIFIGTGNVRMAVKKSNGGGPNDVSSNYDGPVVEVVASHKTKIYKDVSEMPEPDKAVDGVVTTQQVVEAGSLDDLGANMMVTVWGEKQGDRFIADTIVYR